MMSRNEIVNEVKEKFGISPIGMSEDFDKDFEGAVWFSAEDGQLTNEGIQPFNYWAESGFYDLGIYQKLSEYVYECGWYFEFQDAGTVFLCPE